MIQLAAAEGMYGSGKLRKALHITGALEMGAVHAGWKADGFRIVGATKAVDQRLEAGDDLLELAAATIEAVNAGVDQRPAAKSLSSKDTGMSIVVTPKGLFRSCE